MEHIDVDTLAVLAMLIYAKLYGEMGVWGQHARGKWSQRVWGGRLLIKSVDHTFPFHLNPIKVTEINKDVFVVDGVWSMYFIRY